METFKTFFLLAALIDRLSAKVDTLNKRAGKLGLTPVEMVVHDDYIQVIKTKEKKFRVELKGEPVVIGGWKVAGVISNLGNDTALLTGDVPEEYRSRASVCDHCGYNRRRNTTVLLRNLETEELKQVGKSCLKDFVDISNPEKIADIYQEINEINLDEEGHDNEGGETYGDSGNKSAVTLTVLALAIAVIRKDGRYNPVSNLSDFNPVLPTVYKVRDLYYRGQVEISTEDATLAEEILAWGRGKVGEFGYMGNLAAALTGPVCTFQTMGIVVSGVAAYHREALAKAEDQRKRENPSRHFGMVGKRQDFRLKPVSRAVIDGFYGSKTVLGFVDPDGNRAVWFASGIVDTPSVDAEGFAGCKATVKGHEEYRGEAQTVLTRVKF